MGYNSIALIDRTHNKYQLFYDAGHIPSRVKLLEDNCKALGEVLRRDIFLLYDLSKEDIEHKGYHPCPFLYDKLMAEYSQAGGPPLTQWTN